MVIRGESRISVVYVVDEQHDTEAERLQECIYSHALKCGYKLLRFPHQNVSPNSHK